MKTVKSKPYNKELDYSPKPVKPKKKLPPQKDSVKIPVPSVV
jgi:hypothetical protein